MGIVNVTPDSFSDGGLHYGTDEAVEHALSLVEQGADMIDVG
ncbi:PTS mannitol transporter subunit IIABC, partial [Thermoplasmatales archaeon ex4484_6]